MKQDNTHKDKDPVLHDVRLKIQRHDWMALGVSGDAGEPDWTYTIGLYRSYQHPEIVCIGPRPDQTHWFLVPIIEQIKRGGQFEDGKDYGDVIANDYRLFFGAVEVRWYYEFFGKAIDFYEGLDFPVLQCVLPDRQGRFPWDAECDMAFRTGQPLLFNWENK